MSDRVRFGAWNNTGTPLVSSGFSGFPFPLTRGSGAPGTNNPVAMTFADAIQFYWRTRDWEVNCDFAGVNGAGTAAFDVSDVSLNPLNLTRENQLALPASPGEDILPTERLITGGYALPDYDLPGYGLGVAFGISLDLFRTGAPHYQEAPSGGLPGDVWPWIDIVAGFSSMNTHATLLRCSVATDPLATVTAEARIVLPHRTYTFPIYLIGVVDADPELQWNVTGSQITFTATSFWPYAGKDGSAIYEITGGGLLTGRSPTD